MNEQHETMFNSPLIAEHFGPEVIHKAKRFKEAHINSARSTVHAAMIDAAAFCMASSEAALRSEMKHVPGALLAMLYCDHGIVEHLQPLLNIDGIMNSPFAREAVVQTWKDMPTIMHRDGMDNALCTMISEAWCTRVGGDDVPEELQQQFDAGKFDVQEFVDKVAAAGVDLMSKRLELVNIAIRHHSGLTFNVAWVINRPEGAPIYLSESPEFATFSDSENKGEGVRGRLSGEEDKAPEGATVH
jgi:uncharacterized protein (DUF2267 family)